MKTCLTFVFLFVLVVLMPGQTPDFSMMGFATMNGGTSGGEGGAIVTPTNFDELNDYCTSLDPYIILIDRTFKGSNPDSTNPNAPVRRIIRMESNKTLLGVGANGFLNQISIVINTKENIIIRNIRFTMKDVPIDVSGSEVKILGTNSDPDIISISADLSSVPQANRMTKNIWIDHCEFYNEDPAVMTDGDRYDGLIDMKNHSEYITISWCYFHDHHKGCLSGSGNSDNYDRKTTMHHNYFDNISSRIPLQRYGKLHLLNNYVTNSENGLNVRIQSEAIAEGNYFKNTKKPIFGKESEGGTAREIDNYFEDCRRLSHVHIPSVSSPDADPLNTSEEYNSNDYVIPYSYNNHVIDVAEVPDIVTAWAGVGKLSGLSSTTAQRSEQIDEILFTPTIVRDQLTMTIQVKRPIDAVLTMTTLDGRSVLHRMITIQSEREEFQIDMSSYTQGVYIIHVQVENEIRTQKIVKRD